MQYAEDKTTKSRPNQSIVFCVYTGSCKCRVEGQCDFGGECRHKNDFRVDLLSTNQSEPCSVTHSFFLATTAWKYCPVCGVAIG